MYKRLNAYFQVSYGEGAQTTHHFNFSDFCQTYKLPTIRTFNALQVLDRNSVITLSKQFKNKVTVQFIISGPTLFNYLETALTWLDLHQKITNFHSHLCGYYLALSKYVLLCS